MLKGKNAEVDMLSINLFLALLCFVLLFPLVHLVIEFRLICRSSCDYRIVTSLLYLYVQTQG